MNAMDDSEFIKAFESGTLNPQLFDHEAHIKLAWVYLNRYGEKEAIAKTCEGIRNFDRLHGDGTKYHATLTIAAVKAVHHFKRKSKATTFEGFIKEFPRLKTSFKSLLGQHYGIDIISDKKAKTEFVEPDLLPFD